MRHEKIKLYENREDITLTTYVLEDSPEMLDGKKRGAVLICPGGGYLSCSDREGEPVAMAFAAMGYHAFVLRYSVYSPGKMMMPDPAAPLEVRPHSVFPNPMRDIGRAMLCIGEHAEAWLVDTQRIAVCGFSAGAHNSAMYSVYWDKPEIAGFLGVDAERLRPAACILGYTLSDYVFMSGKTAGDFMAETMFRASNIALLGTKMPGGEILQKVSPARLVSKSTPPMFLWATFSDGLVPVQHSTLLATALADCGIPFEMHIFEDGGHGLSVATQATANSQRDVDADAAKWLSLCEAWLYKRFAFKLPAKSAWESAPEEK